MREIITSPSNQIIKLARSLKYKKGRDESGFFLVEGIHHVGEAAEAGWEIEKVIFSPTQLISDFGRKLISDLSEKGEVCQPVSELAFESFAEKENPQGIAAIVRQRSLNLTHFSSSRFIVAVVSPQDPGNVGTILRTIDAVGGNGLILLDGDVDPYHSTVVRSSMGTLFWVPFCTASNKEFTIWSKSVGWRIIGTSAHATVDYRNVTLDGRPTILLLGSEQKGLLTEQIAECDDLVSLPMRGRATSLNLAVATGILLYAFLN